jgi:hypothetical protein
MGDGTWQAGANLYEQIWRNALAAFGWPAERVEWFVAQHAEDLKEKDSFFYHEDPAHYLTFELLSETANEQIRSRLRRKSPGSPWELYHPVHDMLNQALNWYGFAFKQESLGMPDWKTLKADIQAFLAERGEALRYPRQ